MAEHTKISWSDATWNAVYGCSMVSPECENCYAMTLMPRLASRNPFFESLFRRDSEGEPKWTGEVKVHDGHMLLPLNWQEPKRIFVNSQSDLFHEGFDDEVIDRHFAVMALASWHTYQILTKRSKRMALYMNSWAARGRITEQVFKLCDTIHNKLAAAMMRRKLETERIAWPLPNVWLGVSAGTQWAWDSRHEDLRACPAVVRFVSYEPALELVDFHLDERWVWLPQQVQSEFPMSAIPGLGSRAEAGLYRASSNPHGALSVRMAGEKEIGIKPAEFERRNIHQIIVGGESGKNARPFFIDWARNVIKQCEAARDHVWEKYAPRPCAFERTVPFVKQMGSHCLDEHGGYTVCQGGSWPDGTRIHVGETMQSPRRVQLTHHGEDMAEWPEDVRRQEFPTTR